MKISTKGRYALKVMIDLAKNNNGEFTPLIDISKRQQISNKYLEQIVAMLNKAGFLETLRGNNRGYRLAKKPSEYIVGDILRATEGDIAPIACIREEKCKQAENCTTYKFWDGLDKVINDYIDSKTLADIVN